MSKITTRHTVTVVATLQLDEQELGALDALAGYGTDSFLKTFYSQMGRAYLEPHEQGLRRLFDNIHTNIPRVLSDAQVARKLLAEKRVVQLHVEDEAPKPERRWWQFRRAA